MYRFFKEKLRARTAVVARFMGRAQPYDAGGLLVPAVFTAEPRPPATRRTCLSVARSSDSANGGHGGWLTEGGDMRGNCFDVPQLAYRP